MKLSPGTGDGNEETAKMNARSILDNARFLTDVAYSDIKSKQHDERQLLRQRRKQRSSVSLFSKLSEYRSSIDP